MARFLNCNRSSAVDATGVARIGIGGQWGRNQHNGVNKALEFLLAFTRIARLFRSRPSRQINLID